MNNDDDAISRSSEEQDQEQEQDQDQDQCVVGCEHYVRRCRLVAPCCDKVYACRHCHNDAEAHEMDRHAVKEVVCAACNKRQPVSQTCSCGVSFAAYFCAVCNFFDDRIERNYYHCDKCGICRVKGGSEYVHCDNCGTCVASLDHKCKADRFHTDCPICLENLFHSTKPATVLPCGHPMHAHCMMNCMQQGKNSCPLCRKTMLSDDILQKHNAYIDSLIDVHPMQEELTFEIKCNDCGFGGATRFHPYGMKCGGCGGYNTSR